MAPEPKNAPNRLSSVGGSLDEQRLRQLIEVGRSLVSELDPETVLAQVLEVARDLTGARYAALGVLDADRRELERFLTSGIDEEGRAAIGSLPRGRGVLGLLIGDPRPIRLDDVGAHPRSFGFPAGHPPMGSFLGVPVLIRGKAWGNLYLTEKEGGFDAADEAAAVVLAEWTAIAVNNARLYRSIQGQRDELERAVRELEATSEISRAIGGETDLDRILETIVKRGRALIDARTLTLLLVDGNELKAASSAGETSESPAGHRVPLETSLPGQVLGSGKPLRLPHAPADLMAQPTDRDTGSPALLVPLVFRGRRLGVLAALDPRGERIEFSSEDERALTSFAASAAIAVATAQSAAEERVRSTVDAAERERARWARELHDESLQTLAGLRVILSGVRRKSERDEIDAVLGEAITQVDDTIAEMRRLIADLRPPTLNELGVGVAVRSLVERLSASDETGVEIRVDLDLDYESGRQPTRNLVGIEEGVYRFVQEALHNVFRHAGASHAQVSIIEADGKITISVGDDGSGFDTSAETEGFGLLGMRERIALLGGTLEVATPPEGGTIVRASIPARHREAPGVTPSTGSQLRSQTG